MGDLVKTGILAQLCSFSFLCRQNEKEPKRKKLVAKNYPGVVLLVTGRLG
jgi:hypothetical protein